jgi:hypothetical protein
MTDRPDEFPTDGVAQGDRGNRYRGSILGVASSRQAAMLSKELRDVRALSTGLAAEAL